MKYRQGMKYVLVEPERYPVPTWFPHELIQPQYRHAPFVTMNEKWLNIDRGFAWNGANAFPDFGWVMVPSKVHDALLWLLFWTAHEYLDLEAEYKRHATRGVNPTYIKNHMFQEQPHIPEVTRENWTTFKGWARNYAKMDENAYNVAKNATDLWFAELCRERLPIWAKRTPGLMYLATNRASKWVPGPDQGEAHKILEVA